LQHCRAGLALARYFQGQARLGMTTSPMKQDLPLSHDAPRGGKINPAFFVPVLYVMQGMPVTTVQEMFVVTWKDLHVANPLIVSWLSILTLPWSFKLFWSPLIDINSTKRRWTVAMELLLTAAFIAIAWAITLPQYAGDAPQTGFFVALSLLFLMGCFSCTHDIACDGLYILSLTRDQQAKWVGVQSTCYKIGRWLCVGGLVYAAGLLEKRNISNSRSWAIVLTAAAVVYGIGAIYNFFALPKPASDKPAAEPAPGERSADILRTLTVVGIGVCLYFFIATSIRVTGDAIYNTVNANRDAAHHLLGDWSQGDAAQDLSLLGIRLGRHLPVFKQYVMLAGSIVFVIPLFALSRIQLRGTPMAESFGSYVRLRRFWAILLFIMLYRFGEAMVTRTLPLFLKDLPANGGLGVSTSDVGVIVGTFGIFGIILGGILGGIIVARLGLRRAFWPLAISMHIPNLFYLLIAFTYHTSPNPHAWQNIPLTNWPLSFAAFVHETGYGFGFAAYFVFLMDVAQRGKFKTAHYAFGTGLGALCAVFAGIVSAILLATFHGPSTYIHFFIAVCILTVPGMLTLLVIPLSQE
jgi:MFS transporter, PAT family, beta-lactamase induction signal transducer AmpG